ncbi:hypothetical protein BGW80DRAFT_1291025 [Lactifluus volemus]|nr:hypothetical protein BGW80DRAFT_1291025 [Lactifluus volemus]
MIPWMPHKMGQVLSAHYWILHIWPTVVCCVAELYCLAVPLLCSLQPGDIGMGLLDPPWFRSARSSKFSPC